MAKSLRIFIFLFFLTTCFFSFLPNISLAEKKQDSSSQNAALSEWDNDKKRLSEISIDTPKGCHKIFEILWSQSKAGNLEARQHLLLYMTNMGGPYVFLPGPSFDDLTRRRYYAIIAVHSIKDDDNDGQRNYIDGFYKHVRGLGSNTNFGKCMREKRSSGCVDIAVKENKIPPFESFAKEIDLFMQQGMMAMCIGVRR